MSSYPNSHNLTSPFLVNNILMNHNSPWTDQNMHAGLDYSHASFPMSGNYDYRMDQIGTSSSCLYPGNTSSPPMSSMQPTYTTLSPQSLPLSDGPSRHDLGQYHTASPDSGTGKPGASETQLLTPKSEQVDMDVLENRKLNIISLKREMSEPYIPLILIKGHLIRPLLNIYWFSDFNEYQ